jgi:hypothetical protein
LSAVIVGEQDVTRKDIVLTRHTGDDFLGKLNVSLQIVCLQNMLLGICFDDDIAGPDTLGMTLFCEMCLMETSLD